MTFGFPKPEPIKKVKARRKHRERKVVGDVRPQVMDRDGYCRLAGLPPEFGPCSGPQEWAHSSEMRRSKTRKQDPEQRHTTAGSYAACRYHHNRMDGRALPRIWDRSTTERGANGPVRWWTIVRGTVCEHIETE